MEFMGQLTHMHTSPGGTGTEKEITTIFTVFGETQAVARCNWAAPAGRRYQLSLEELVAVFFPPGSPALTAALEPLKVVSKRQRGAREPQKSAATWPENLKVSVRCHHRLLNKENRSSSGMLIQLVLNHLTLKSGDTHIALSKAQLQHKTAHFHHSFSLRAPHFFHRISEVGKDL